VAAKIIQLTNGYVALVDSEDFDFHKFLQMARARAIHPQYHAHMCCSDHREIPKDFHAQCHHGAKGNRSS